MSQMQNALINPDCRNGSHRACVGDAWNDFTDAPTECRCSCHERGAR